ncbi:MAG: DUF4091 domain-containing protein [Bacteroidales bacterium]|nr:DUF4091 domain-containing protein [Bacteroidales bacterium]
MKKDLLVLLIATVFIFPGCSNNNPEIKNSEPSDPDTYDLSSWEKVENNLNAAFVSSNDAIMRSLPPEQDLSETANITAWKGETVHAQLAIWSKNYTGELDVTTNYKVAENNPGPGLFQVRQIKYVISDSFINGCGWRDKDTIDAHISPDRLEPRAYFSIVAKETRPVWLSLQIPTECEAGIYKYNTEIRSSTDTIIFDMELEVIDRVLPDPSEWQFHLDLWQNPYAVARYHNVPEWSQEHWNLLEPLLVKLASAGQKCITTTLNNKPWGAQTFDPFGSMINWIKDNNGKWAYDYSIFDQYIEFAMDCGITKQINCYSMVPWGNKLSYFSEDSTRYVEIEARPGTDKYNEIWEPFLIDFREHLRDKGWLDITTIAMDERKEKDMKNMISLIKSTAPELKITLAGNILQPEIDNELYDLSIAIGLNPDKESVKARVSSGKPTTFYTCCARPEHPNNFTFSPPADNTYIGWYAAAWGYSGFLRWAYNSWVEDPVYDSRFRTWPSGDTFFVYPEAQSSVRFEKLVEGIQDYEKIRILKEDLAGDPSMEAEAYELELNEFLNSLHYSQLKERPSKEYILEGQSLLYRIATR